jgi:SAM-dependent methyltransferase
MNRKIFAELVTKTNNDVSKVTSQLIKDTFDVEVDKSFDNLVDYTNEIDIKCLHKYFAYHWDHDMKKWKHSGLALIDQIHDMKPRAVLDVGCGYNEFKGKIHNLIGVDPYNDRADHKIDILEYRSIEKFDIILALGSINFGGRNKIIAEVSKCVNMLENGGMMFFRVNPGVQHEKPEAKWIEFYAWNVPFIIELAEMFNLKVLDIRDDSNKRKYFVYRKVK